MTTRTAVVVGGGIGGLATACGLIRGGWEVRVLEQAEEFSEVGAAISLWPNAFRALETVGALDRLAAPGLPNTGGLRDWRGTWLARLDGLDEVAEATSAAVVAHRAELLDALLAGVPAESRLPGARVRGVRVAGDRAVVEYDGGELAADLVVGADGVRSAVRQAVFPDTAPPRYAGSTAWRMVLPWPRDLAGGESWGRGSVFGAFPMPGDRVYCYATAKLPPGGRAPDTELAELRRRFDDWHDPIPDLLAAATPEQVLRNDIHHLPPLPGYVRGRVALLGDAAHAMTPNLGQGGCQALEDAATLSVLANEDDLDAALRRYDALRRPRTQTIAKRALMGNAAVSLSSRPACAARNLLVRLVPTSLFVRSLTGTFDWRPPGVIS
ncbi:MAG TPA: FAD-dependent monooxygenase [Actinophytocola sp.]|nr:FAD-dependent monooxygenase [Actinophytocola sp.]